MGHRPMLVWGAPLALLRLRGGEVDGAFEQSSAASFVLRGFEEWVFCRAADHLMEGGAGGDHGVDAVFFFYLEVDQEGLAAGAGSCDGWSYILALVDGCAVDAVGCG